MVENSFGGVCGGREPQVLLAKSQTVRSFLVKGGPNPTWAGPYSSRNPCSNFPTGKVCSQRRPVTGGGEGARQGQGGRCRVSASHGCQALPHAEARTGGLRRSGYGYLLGHAGCLAASPAHKGR